MNLEFDHDAIRIRHGDRRVVGIIANSRGQAEWILHGDGIARTVIGDLGLAASVVDGDGAVRGVVGHMRRDRGLTLRVEERNGRRTAALAVGEGGDRFDRPPCRRPASPGSRH